jgi:hypothetical protein
LPASRAPDRLRDVTPAPTPLQLIGEIWPEWSAGILPPLTMSMLLAVAVWLWCPRASLKGLGGRAVWVLGWLRIGAVVLFAIGVLWPALQFAEDAYWLIFVLPQRWAFWDGSPPSALHMSGLFRAGLLCPVALLLWCLAPLFARRAALLPLVFPALVLQCCAGVLIALACYAVLQEAWTAVTWESSVHKFIEQGYGPEDYPLNLVRVNDWTPWALKLGTAAVCAWLLAKLAGCIAALMHVEDEPTSGRRDG